MTVTVKMMESGKKDKSKKKKKNKSETKLAS